MSNYCSDCGKPLATGAGFCGACGASVSQRQQGFSGMGGQQQSGGYAPAQPPYQPSYGQSSTYSRRPDREISGLSWMIEPYRRYADFNGRSRRMEYWMFTLFQTIVLFVLGGITLAGIPWVELAAHSQAVEQGLAAGPEPQPGPLVWIGGGLLLIWWLASFIPSIAVTVRRFHDQEKSGWFYLLGMIPYVGGLILLVFMFMDGTRGPNQYGDDPKGQGGGDVFR